MSEATETKSSKSSDLAKLDKLQKEYDELKAKVPHEGDGQKQRELLLRKGDVVREMDVIKRKYDVQPESPASKQGEPNPDRELPPVVGGRPAAAAAETENPVADMNAAEAVEAVGHMRSKEKLQAVAANDTRATVKEAAAARLAQL